MKILHVVSYCLLSALCVVESAVVNVKEVVGGQVKIKCSHKWAGDNVKYFCKIKCNQGDLLVQTKGSKHYIEKARYTIEDLRNGVFYVTIKNLMKSDSGTYWCGVERFGPDSFQEVHLIVTDAPPTPTPSPVTSRPHVSTILPNLSAASPNTSTILPNLSTTFLTSGDITGHFSSGTDYLPSDYSPGVGQNQSSGLMVWTSVGLVVMVTVLGLVLLLFSRQRRRTRRTPPPPPVDCVYEEIREADRQTDTLPVVISSVYSTVNSPTNYTTYPAGQDSTNPPGSQASTTYPAGQASTTYPAGQDPLTYPAGQGSTTYHADQASTTYPDGHATSIILASLIYSNVDLPTDSRVSSSPPTASGTQDDSIYSTAQLPKDTVESTRYPAVHLSKDTPEDAIYSTAQLPKI
ncbi:unnamed protein product, partial [Coregonus sp. 'balchen']